jgi:hypothetical protein
MIKPKVFLGSTGEGKKYVESMLIGLNEVSNPKPWYQGVFEIGVNQQDSLVNGISSSDFVVIVMTADDKTRTRGGQYYTPRDNLIFESGIAFGALGPERVFLIPQKTRGFKLPSDLNGFTVTLPFDPDESDPNVALSAAIAQITQRIRSIGRKSNSKFSGKKPYLAQTAVDLIKSADHSVVMFGRDLSWADSYLDIITKKTESGVVVEVFSDLESRVRARGNAKKLVNAGAKVRYCQHDTGIKMTLIDHHAVDQSRFMLSFKERAPMGATSSLQSSEYEYHFEIHDARSSPVLWNTLVRLYRSLQIESGPRKDKSKSIRSASKSRSMPKTKPRK